MKKFSKFCAAISLFVLSIIFSLNLVSTKSAYASSNNNVSYAEFLSTANSILNSYSQFKNRAPGSDGEKRAAIYIVDYLDSNTECLPLNNDYISDGVQSFRFESALDGGYYSSQNIIYTHNSKTDTDKKIIIGCNYDSIAFNSEMGLISGELVESESINGSAGSVSLLLSLAKYLSLQDFDFNIEFIFFGAGESENAGSTFFTQGISKDDAKNIALMINLDKVAVGKNLYFYVDEIENDFSKYVKKVSLESELGLKNVSTANLGKVLLNSPNKLGLKYEHIAIKSNNINFMSENILTMNIFSGDYSDGISLGISEYSGKDSITYTSNDNMSYISEHYGEYAIFENLYNSFNSIKTLLNQSNFLKVCLDSTNQTSWLYNIFGNEKLIAYLTILMIIVFIAVILLINYKLTKRAYYSNIEIEFVKSVVGITGNIDESTCKDVPEVVSEILVRDIKKDKRIKGKKKK